MSIARRDFFRSGVYGRPPMLPAIAENFLRAGADAWLFIVGRITAPVRAPFRVDLAIGIACVVSYVRTAECPW